MIYIYLFIAASVFILIRSVLGPSFADRIIAISAFINVLILSVVVWSVSLENSFLLDIAIILSILPFVGILAIAKYVRKR